MIPNVLPFQPEAAPAVLPSTGRGAAPLSGSDSGSFAGILQVKLPGQGDSPAPTAKGTDGGSAAPTLSATAQPAPDAKEKTAAQADPANAGAAATAEADPATTAKTQAASQPTPQFVVGMGNVIRFPSQRVADPNRQEATRQTATFDAETASAMPAVDAEIAADAKSVAKDDPTPVAEQKTGDKETAADAASSQAAPVNPPVAAILAAPAPQIAALAAALVVPVTTTTTTAPQQVGNAVTAATETVAAAAPSATTLPASKTDVPASGAALPQEPSAATVSAPTIPVAGAAQPVSATASAPGFIPANEARPAGQPSLQEDRPVPFFQKAEQFQGERTATTAATSQNGTGKVQAVPNMDPTSVSQMIRQPRAEQAAAPVQPAAQTATALPNQAVSDSNAGVGMAAGGSVATREEVSPQNRQVAAPAPEDSGTKIATSGAPRVEVTALSAPVADNRPIETAPVMASVQQTAAPAATTATAQQQVTQQAGPAQDAVREPAVTAREQRSARMVRDIYGSGYRANKAQQDDSAQHLATQELRDAGVTAQKADATAAEVSKSPAPTGNAEATAPAPAQIQTVKAQPVVAAPAAMAQADSKVRESAEAAASQPVETGKAAEATGGVTQAKGTVRDTATAAAGTVARGELKQEERSQEQPEVKVAQAGTANAIAKPETGSKGGFSDAEQKEQQDQKHPVKEQTQAQQSLGLATPQQQVEAPAPAPKSAAATTLHESILSQVKDGVVVHDGKGNGQISIRLNPGELGELKIQVRMDDGNKVRVEVQADNKMVKDLLLSNVQSLKETLAAKNFTMEGFDVSTGSRDSFNNPNNNPLADDRGSWQQQRQTTRSANLTSYSDGVEPVRVNYLTGDVNNLLDVRF